MKRLTLLALLMFTTCIAEGSSDDVDITDGNSLQSALVAVERAHEGQQLSALEQAREFYALGYLRAWLGSSKIWSTVASPQMVSLPENGISVGQLAQIVQKYLREHPESLHETADGLVFTALMVSFHAPVDTNGK